MKPVKYNLVDFFPNCILPSCEQFKLGIEHQHILDHQQMILDSTAKYLYIQGGVGSAKSLVCAIKVVYLSLIVPNNKWVVSRFHYDDLFDSSWREVNDALKRLVEKDIISEPKYTKKVQGEYTEILLHNGSEIKAIQGKNLHRGLGANHGGFWVDDAMESFEEFFIGNETSAGLLSRLRLPHVRFDMNVYDEVTRPHGYLQGISSTNPPPIGHYLHKLFGNKPGMHKLGDDMVEWIMCATSDNPFAGTNYATGLMAIQSKMGRSANVVRRVIFGESVPAYGGVPVYPQFDESKHIGHFPFDHNLPLVCGWDFGFHHPAVVFSNLLKCEFGYNHYISVGEVADGVSLTVYSLYKDYVQPYIKDRFSNASLILHAGDKAGYRASSSNKDKRGDMKILIDEYNIPFLHRTLDLKNSLQYMRGLLNPKKQCKCGLEFILIDQLYCPVLIGALQGGYKYPKPRGGTVGEKPVEDRWFADIACAWRYGAENFVKWGIPWEYQGYSEPTVKRIPQNEEPWAWMGYTDTQMAALLTQ